MKYLLTENATTVKRIALDMDGVICDFSKQYRKYLANDSIWNSVVNYRKAISQRKLDNLNMERPEFVKSATDLRNKILDSGEVDVYGIVGDQFRKNFTMSPAWDVLMKGQENYWSDMDWQDGGKELVKYLRSLNIPIEILTAGAGGYADRGKQAWLQKAGLGGLKFNIVNSGKDKWEFAKEGDLLIDDMEKNVKLFVEAGGMGIIHTSTPNTIEQLHKAGL